MLTRVCGARVAEERRGYYEAAAAGPALAPGQEPDLGMRVILVHGMPPAVMCPCCDEAMSCAADSPMSLISLGVAGDETIGDSEEHGGLAPALARFKAWVRRTYFGEGGQA